MIGFIGFTGSLCYWAQEWVKRTDRNKWQVSFLKQKEPHNDVSVDFVMAYFAAMGRVIPRSGVFRDVLRVITKKYALADALTEKKVQRFADALAGDVRTLLVYSLGLAVRSKTSRTCARFKISTCVYIYIHTLSE